MLRDGEAWIGVKGKDNTSTGRVESVQTERMDDLLAVDTNESNLKRP